MQYLLRFFLLLLLLQPLQSAAQAGYVSYRAQPAAIAFYWKDDKGSILGSLGRLQQWLEGRGKTLLFAMNGGMYTEDQSPLGLYIENGRQLKKMNTRSGSGNFYMQPNGVFYITKNGKAAVCRRQDYKASAAIRYATQSGPMLLINGAVNTKFTKGSQNLNIRNGVGILPDGQVLFAMSKSLVNFYDFALFFKNAGCRNALYLDGAISQAWHPAAGWKQTGGAFGVMIGVVAER